MTREELLKPAYPPQLDEEGWPLSSNTGFNKLEAASLQIAANMMSLPVSWEILFSDPKPPEQGKGRVFNTRRLAKNAVKIAKAVLEECQKELNE